MGGWPKFNPKQNLGPHLRHSLIVAKVGTRATRETVFRQARVPHFMTQSHRGMIGAIAQNANPKNPP